MVALWETSSLIRPMPPFVCSWSMKSWVSLIFVNKRVLCKEFSEWERLSCWFLIRASLLCQSCTELWGFVSFLLPEFYFWVVILFWGYFWGYWRTSPCANSSFFHVQSGLSYLHQDTCNFAPPPVLGLGILEGLFLLSFWALIFHLILWRICPVQTSR